MDAVPVFYLAAEQAAHAVVRRRKRGGHLPAIAARRADGSRYHPEEVMQSSATVPTLGVAEVDAPHRPMARRLAQSDRGHANQWEDVQL